MRWLFPGGIDTVVTVKTLLGADLLRSMRKPCARERNCRMARVAVECSRNMASIFPRCQGAVMASSTRPSDPSVIHFCAFNKADRYVMAEIALRRGRDMICWLTACDYTIVAAGTLLRCAFEYAANMAGFAGYELMLTY
ncbi:MAG: hypothetical protein HY273_16050 [Gammaproteobacteria bacterium]|nr:hypothetical protein [Gammaproteobacteria bacterium]